MDLAVPDAVAVHRTIGLTLAASFKTLTGNDDPSRAEAFRKLFVERADEVMVPLTSLYPQSSYVLMALRQRGICTGIVSTKYRYRIQGILDRFDLADAVDVIVGGEDV